MVKIGKWFTVNALRIKLPIKRLIKATIFRQFCGGETIAECRTTTESLAKFGVGTILDYSIEGKTSEEDFEATVAEIIRTIEVAKNDANVPFAVFKVTGIAQFKILERANQGLEQLTDEESRAYHSIKDRVHRICEAGFNMNVRVFIDAEETWIQDTIDTLAKEMMLLFNRKKAIVYNTVQMYRHDRLAFLEKELNLANTDGYQYGVKLVRGAYMEKERARAIEKGYPSPIQPDKVTCDRDFDKALELLVENRHVMALCAGSHNEKSSLFLTQLMAENDIPAHDERFYFAQLLGMSDHISYNLSDAGYKVAKYVPYGPVHEVMPYLLRRADENTSVAGQTGRELSLIMKELKRRKK
jgi:proline dehydrogenase